MIIAGLLAGGKGIRMNLKTPKQFLKIGNIPILIRTLNKFLPNVDKVIIATNKDYINKTNYLLKKYNIDKNKIVIVIGGENRFESLINVIKKAYEIDKKSIIITHDVARPFVSQKIIKDNLEAIKNYDAVTTSISTIDTVIIAENGIEKDVPNREFIYLDQGPQTVKTKQFVNLLNKVDKKSCIEIGKMYLSCKLKVGIVDGDRLNFKITNQFDLEFAKYLLERGKVI